MIRQRLHRRWAATPGAMLRSIQRHPIGGRPGRYFNWHTERYGESGDGEPWYMRPVTRFVCWVDDWGTTWRMRP